VEPQILPEKEEDVESEDKVDHEDHKEQHHDE